MGRLDIRICAARNLPDVQTFGKIDPYVIVTLEHQTHKTSVCSNTEDPHWNEVFKFQIADPDSSQLKFELWNKNLVSDDFLGGYNLSCAGLVKGQVKDDWYLLKQCKSNAELHIRLLAHDFGIEVPGLTAANAEVMNQAGFIHAQAPPQGGYHQQQQGYPPQQQGYPPQQQGYPPQQQGYPPQQQGYPPQQQGYPPQQHGYPPQQQGYPPQQQGYPPQQQGYPPQQPGYPQQYPPQQPGYPPQQPGYPPQQQGYPPQQQGYPQQGGYPPQGSYNSHPQPGHVYHLTPGNAPNKVLGCAGGATGCGTHLVLWDRDGSPNQKWRLEERGNGLVAFAPMHAQNMHLDTNNGCGNTCHLWDNGGNPMNPNQLFRLEPVGDNRHYYIRRASDGAVLDVANYRTDNGATLHAWSDLTRASNQQWHLEQTY